MGIQQQSHIIMEHIMMRIGVRQDRFGTQQEYWFAKSGFIYTITGLLVAMSYFVFYTVIDAQEAAYSLGALALVLIGTLLLHRFGLSRLAFKINLSATSLALAGVVAHTGGISSSAACWLLGVTPGITALLFRRPLEIIQLTLLTILLYIVIFFLEMSGYPVHQLGYAVGSTFERSYTFLHFAFFSMFIAMALSIFAITQQRLYDHLTLNKIPLETTTTNLKAIFTSIHQAVFLISADLKISQDRSARFVDVLGPSVHSLKEILQGSEISGDQKAQAIEAVQISIGEDAINFLVNEHLLPSELKYRKHPNAMQQVLSLHWSPVLHGDIVRDILVEVRDISMLVESKAKEQESSYRNSLLLVLLQANSNQLPTFIRDLERLERELMGLQHEFHQDLLGFKAIVHTIKGNARSQKLWVVADTAHQLETLLEPKNQTMNRPQIQATATLLIRQLQDFCTIYHEISMKSHTRQGAISIDTEDLQLILENLQPASATADLLTKLQTMLPNSLASLAENLRHETAILAGELGKFEPHLDVNEKTFLFAEASRPALFNAIGHITRNALDHGIEDPNFRRELGKSPQGTIRLQIQKSKDGYQLQISDDGRGLNLDQIRDKALQKGLSPRSDEEIAELVFLDGFSTSNKVSMISGRGVGLASALRDLRLLGGDIKIVFTGPAMRGYRPFYFEISWPQKPSAKDPETLSKAL